MEKDCSSVERTALQECSMAQVQEQDPRLGPMREKLGAPEAVCADPSNTDLAPRPAGRNQLENDRDASALPAVDIESDVKALR